MTPTPERMDARAVLALSVYEVKSEHMEWCHACLRWTVDGHSETCLAGALSQTLTDLEAMTDTLLLQHSGTDAVWNEKHELETQVMRLPEPMAAMGDGPQERVTYTLERLASAEAFARRVAVHVFDSFELDYCDFIDVGVETGVLRKEAYDPAKHGESDCEPGDDFYVLAIPSQEAT